MALFGRKGTKEEAASGAAAYRFMLDLERAQTVAAMIAKSRASRVIEVADMVAGMYLTNWERLSRYWKEEDHDRVENYLRRICQISPQRWNTWMEFYDAERRRAGHSDWNALAELKSALLRFKNNDTAALRPSADLAAVLKQAEIVAPFRDTLDGRQLPVLTSECVLLCIASAPGSEIAHRLVESGLDLPNLDQEARHPRHTPPELARRNVTQFSNNHFETGPKATESGATGLRQT